MYFYSKLVFIVRKIEVNPLCVVRYEYAIVMRYYMHV